MNCLKVILLLVLFTFVQSFTLTGYDDGHGECDTDPDCYDDEHECNAECIGLCGPDVYCESCRYGHYCCGCYK